MIRFLMGLSLVCFVIGCGEAETSTDKPEDSTPAAESGDGGESAAVETEEPAAGENVAATEEPKPEEGEQAEQPAKPMVVKFKVPGMT